MRYDATKEMFEAVTVLGMPMLLAECRVDKKTIPEEPKLYFYEVRHADDDWGDPCEIADWIMVNFFGALISKTPIEGMARNERLDKSYIGIDRETQWNYEGYALSLDDYIHKDFEEIRRHKDELYKNIETWDETAEE